MKDVFEDLDKDFKSEIENMNDEDIRKKISRIAINEHENITAKKKDEDLIAKKEIVKVAQAPYSEATKANKLRIAYAYHILESRGKE